MILFVGWSGPSGVLSGSAGVSSSADEGDFFCSVGGGE
jgi:hypothetical protein